MIEFDLLKQKVAEAEAEVAKFDGGNKAAGTRVRKAMQDIKAAAQAIREKVLQSRQESPGEVPQGQPPAAPQA